MAAGFRHGVPVEVAYHLLDLHHQRGDSVVRGFIGMSLENPPHKKQSRELKSGEWAVGYSDFHNLKGFTRKKMPNNILKNVY